MGIFTEKPIAEEEDIKVNICPFEHDGKLKGKQDVVRREMGNNLDENKMHYMQCGICGACGPASDSVAGAARRWNMRLVKVYEREAFEEIKGQIASEEKKAKNKAKRERKGD